MEKVFILSEKQLKDLIVREVEWIGEMGWYREKDGRWLHDDETGYFESTETMVKFYALGIPKEYRVANIESDEEIEKSAKEKYPEPTDRNVYKEISRDMSVKFFIEGSKDMRAKILQSITEIK